MDISRSVAAPPKRRRGTRGARRRADGRRLRIQRRLRARRRPRRPARRPPTPTSRCASPTCPSRWPTATTPRCSPRRRRWPRSNNSTIKVFDAANDPKKQFAQLQTATSSGDYDAIIVQPIFGTGLITGVQDAIAAGKKVVNMDQILGKDMSTDQPQVDGLSGNVVFVPTEIGDQARQARHPGLPGEEPRPLQDRLPLRHQGLGARRRDQEVLRRGDRRQPGQDRRPGRELLHAGPRA